jgi:hypothetical protein
MSWRMVPWSARLREELVWGEALTVLQVYTEGGECTLTIIGNIASKAELNEWFRPIGTFQEAQKLTPPKAREIIQKGTFEVRRHWEMVFILAHSRQEASVPVKIIHWPSIWLLVGTCLIEDASTWSFWQSALDISGIVEILPPDVMMLIPILQLKPEVRFKVWSNFCKLQGPRSKAGEYGRHGIKAFTPTTWRFHPTRPSGNW